MDVPWLRLGGRAGAGQSSSSVNSSGLLSALSVVNGTVRIAAPNVVHHGRTVFNGSFVTGHGDVQLGETWKDNIDFRGTIKGRTAFSFGGAVDDERPRQRRARSTIA